MFSPGIPHQDWFGSHRWRFLISRKVWLFTAAGRWPPAIITRLYVPRVIYGPLHGQILEGPVSASHNNPPLSVPQGPWGKPSFGRVPKEAKRPGMIAAPSHVLHRCESLFSFSISVRQEKSNQKRKVPPLQRRGFSSSLQADLLDPRKMFRGERNYVAGSLSAPL